MNILPKKSWHVRTQKNIARVRNDEAEAEKIAQDKDDRRLRAEQEARMRELRIRAGIISPSESETQKHFDLFEGLNDDKDKVANKDHELEKRLENDSKEQKSGFLNKLVRPQDVNNPWYCNASSSVANTSGIKNFDSTETYNRNREANMRKRARSDLITSIYDPMTTMKDAEQVVKTIRAERRREEERKGQAPAKQETQSHLLHSFTVKTDPSLNSQDRPVHLIESSDDSDLEIIQEIKSNNRIDQKTQNRPKETPNKPSETRNKLSELRDRFSKARNRPSEARATRRYKPKKRKKSRKKYSSRKQYPKPTRVKREVKVKVKTEVRVKKER